MNGGIKAKQIVVRFDVPSFEKIRMLANIEHRGLGEFVRHAVLVYIEGFDKEKEVPEKGEHETERRSSK